MPKLNRNVRLLGLVSFLTDVSSEMIFPLIPIFLTSVLGAPASVLGLIEGIAESTANIVKMGAGIYSDKIRKRKPFVLGGYGLSALVKPLFALSFSWTHIFAARFLDRLGKGIRGSPRDAIIADYTDEKTRGKAFGYRKMMDSLGATVGPFIAFLILPVLLASNPEEDAYRILFAIAVIPAALSVIVLYFVREKESHVKKGWKFRWGEFSRRYKTNLALSFLFSLGTFSYAFFILRAQDAGVSLVLIPLVYMFYNLVYSMAAIPSGSLSDRVGRRTVILFGYLLFGITCLGFGFANEAVHIWLLFGLYGVFMAIMETVQRAFVSDLVPTTLRGSALGMYYGAVGFAALPAGIIAGLLWEVELYGVRATFLFSAAVAFLSLMLFFVLVKEQKKKGLPVVEAPTARTLLRRG
ncbi:MAG: MFS transporter [Candidatus Micrarchaeota archaeon]